MQPRRQFGVRIRHAYVAIVIGRRVLGRKNLDASTALAMLTDALSRCHSEDMRTLEVFARSESIKVRANTPRGLKSLDPDRSLCTYENVGSLTWRVGSR